MNLMRLQTEQTARKNVPEMFQNVPERKNEQITPVTSGRGIGRQMHNLLLGLELKEKINWIFKNPESKGCSFPPLFKNA